MPDRSAGRELLDLLHDPAVLEVVPTELLGSDDDPELLAAAGELVERLVRPTRLRELLGVPNT